MSYPPDFLFNSGGIDFGATNIFLSNQYLFAKYTEYKHGFQTGIVEKIDAYSHGIVNLRLNDYESNIPIFTFIHVSLELWLGHNLLSIILLAKKSIEVFWREAS